MTIVCGMIAVGMYIIIISDSIGVRYSMCHRYKGNSPVQCVMRRMFVKDSHTVTWQRVEQLFWRRYFFQQMIAQFL